MSNSFHSENFYRLGEIPHPQYIGGRGDTCRTNTECHENLYCYSGICSHWNPIQQPEKRIVSPMLPPSPDFSKICTRKEDCQGGWMCVNNRCQLKEGFANVSPPTQPTQSTREKNVQNLANTLSYTSKFKSNFGKNYYQEK